MSVNPNEIGNHPPKSGNKHEVVATLKKQNPCSSQTGTRIIRKVLKLDTKFEYQIEGQNMDKEKTKKHQFSSDAVSFQHRYELMNRGPSPTNKPYFFFVKVPTAVAGAIMTKPESQTDCSKTTLSSTETGSKSEVACNSDPCTQFTCTIKADWKRDNPIWITVNMKFRPKQMTISNGGDLPKSITIRTSLVQGKVDGKVTESVAIFEKDALGALKQIVEYWPYAVGILIGIIIVGSVIFGLVKTGTFAKLRFHKMKLESEKRKTMQLTEGLMLGEKETD